MLDTHWLLTLHFKCLLTAGIIFWMGITPQQFKALQDRLASPRRGVQAVSGSTLSAPVFARGILIGIDPSLRGTGFGVIRVERGGPVLLAQGTISCPAGWERSRCLAKIAQSIRDVVRANKPETCVVEGLFYAQNLQTALIMGEARGASLAAVAEAGLPIYEIAPRKVKQAIVGYGAARKLAVAKMVQRMLKLTNTPEPDAADALALALVFAQEYARPSLSPPNKV